MSMLKTLKLVAAKPAPANATDRNREKLVRYAVRAVATMIEEVFKSTSPLADIAEWAEHLDMLAR